MSTNLPAPWTARECERCGMEHTSIEDCAPTDYEDTSFEPEEMLDILADLAEIFGPPQSFGGILFFGRPPRAD